MIRLILCLERSLAFQNSWKLPHKGAQRKEGAQWSNLIKWVHSFLDCGQQSLKIAFPSTHPSTRQHTQEHHCYLFWPAFGCCALFFFGFRSKYLISTSERRAEHPFAGRNTQQFNQINFITIFKNLLFHKIILNLLLCLWGKREKEWYSKTIFRWAEFKNHRPYILFACSNKIRVYKSEKNRNMKVHILDWILNLYLDKKQSR